MTNSENAQPSKSRMVIYLVFAALITAAVIMRVWGTIPNFQPVAGLALFAGFLLPKRRWAVAGILLLMLTSDLLIDRFKYDVFVENYPWQLMVVVYACFTLPVFAGALLKRFERRIPFLTGIIGSSVICSLLFFLLTNWACWQWQVVPTYSMTLSGLGECMAAGLPFLRATIAGDLVFASMLFASWYLITGIIFSDARESAKPTSI